MQLLEIDLLAFARATREYLLGITELPPVMRTFLTDEGPALIAWMHGPGSFAGDSCAEERSLTRELMDRHKAAWGKFQAAGGREVDFALCYFVCYFAHDRVPPVGHAAHFRSIVTTFWKTGGLSALCALLRMHDGLDQFRDDVFALELLCRPTTQEHPDTMESSDAYILAQLLERITARRAAEKDALETRLEDERNEARWLKADGYH